MKKMITRIMYIVVLIVMLGSIVFADVVSYMPDYNNFPSGYPVGHGGRFGLYY